MTIEQVVAVQVYCCNAIRCRLFEDKAIMPVGNRLRIS